MRLRTGLSVAVLALCLTSCSIPAAQSGTSGDPTAPFVPSGVGSPVENPKVAGPATNSAPNTNDGGGSSDNSVGSPVSAPPLDGQVLPQPGIKPDWKTGTRTYVERGASGMAVYSKNVEGAVVALEDFFTLLKWEMTDFYQEDEENARSLEEEYNLFTKQFFRTMNHIDAEALGQEKTVDTLEYYGLNMTVVDGEIAVIRDGVSMAHDGSVTITGDKIFRFH